MPRLQPYIKIARPDHWTKNVFMLPGVILAFYDNPTLVGWETLPRLVLAAVSLCILASSNYVINEIVDAPMDRYHPKKKKRPIPSGQVRIPVAYVEWITLGVLGLVLARFVTTGFFISGLTLLVMGIVYNIRPIRLKDLPYLDVLSESVNNPIRLLMGWYAAGNQNLIMISIVMCYWMLGAFLMAVKRYAEFKQIGSAERALKYRKSFAYYTINRLLTSIIYYATAFGLFGGIFIVRYKIELILSVPFLAGFMAYYLHLGFLDDSPTQYPENLYKYKGFVLYTFVCAVVLISFLFIDIPIISEFFSGRPK